VEARVVLPKADPLQLHATGIPFIRAEVVQMMMADEVRYFPVITLLFAVTIIVLFRRVWLGLTPLVGVLFGCVWAMGVLLSSGAVLNILSILASFGALVFVFQQGHFQSLLGFTSQGITEASVPILLFSIVFGLSMDYEVFLLSRIKEEYEATGDNTHAVAVGMEKSGRIITSAALVLILVSAGFASGDILIVKTLGFGVALAILIDSTVVRALLVPALMRLFSSANWWAPA